MLFFSWFCNILVIWIFEIDKLLGRGFSWKRRGMIIGHGQARTGDLTRYGCSWKALGYAR